MIDLVIKNAVVLEEAGEFKGGVAVKDGVIVAMGTDASLPQAVQEIDSKGSYLLPGGVDPHCHIRYPAGDNREDFETGTKGAAISGTTSIIEMPISIPPLSSMEALKARIKAIKNQAVVDVALFGCAGGNHLEQIGLIAQTGIVGYKTYLHAPQKGREKDFESICTINNFQLYKVMQNVAQAKLPLAAHGEDNELMTGLMLELQARGQTKPYAHVLSRPAIVETLAVSKLLQLAKETDCELYLVHISIPESVAAAIEARNNGVKLWIETCPHYLYLTDEALDKFGAFAKCNPALRDSEQVKQMWQYVVNGYIDTIGSDHVPYRLEDKISEDNNIFKTQSGFPGIETRNGLMLNAVTEGKVSLKRAIDLLCTNPAKAFGLYPQKGAIRIGADADFMICDLSKRWTVDSKKLQTRARDVAKVYDGWPLSGRISHTIIRGKVVCENRHFMVEPGFGQWLTRKKG